MSFVDVQVCTYNGQLQGQSSPGFAWLLFDGSVDAAAATAAAVPGSASSKNFTLTDADMRRVCINASCLFALLVCTHV